MRPTALLLGLSLVLAATPVDARGIGRRSSSQRSARGGRITGVTTGSKALKMNRAGGRGYRRTPGVASARAPRKTERSLLQRTSGAFFGRNFRDGITTGGGRWNAERYDNPLDKALARRRGTRVTGYTERIGSAVGRLLRP